jgi:hypothetical protein
MCAGNKSKTAQVHRTEGIIVFKPPNKEKKMNKVALIFWNSVVEKGFWITSIAKQDRGTCKGDLEVQFNCGDDEQADDLLPDVNDVLFDDIRFFNSRDIVTKTHAAATK